MIIVLSILFSGLLGMGLGFFCGFIICDNKNLRDIISQYEYEEEDDNNRNYLERLFDNPD